MDSAIIAAAVGAFSAIVVSLVTMATNRKEIKSEAISKNRVEWIKDVRNLIMQFLDEYMNKEKADKVLLEKQRNKISLYLRPHVNSYERLLNALDDCIKCDYDELKCNELIKSAQAVFSEVWIRAKMESGISQRENSKFEKMFKNPINWN